MTTFKPCKPPPVNTQMGQAAPTRLMLDLEERQAYLALGLEERKPYLAVGLEEPHRQAVRVTPLRRTQHRPKRCQIVIRVAPPVVKVSANE